MPYRQKALKEATNELLELASYCPLDRGTAPAATTTAVVAAIAFGNYNAHAADAAFGRRGSRCPPRRAVAAHSLTTTVDAPVAIGQAGKAETETLSSVSRLA